MHLGGGLIAGLTLAALAGVAQAEVKFADFHRICAATKAQPAVALAEAGRAGWLVMPRSMVVSMQPAPATVVDGRVWSDAEGLSFLWVGESPRGADDPAGYNVCAMLAGGAGEAFAAEARMWAKVAPEKSKKKSETDYYFVERGGAHRPMPAGDPEAAEALTSGDARMLSVKNDKDGVMLLLMAFTQ